MLKLISIFQAADRYVKLSSGILSAPNFHQSSQQQEENCQILQEI